MRSILFFLSVGLLALGGSLPKTSGQKFTGGASHTPTLNSFPPPSEKLASRQGLTLVCMVKGFISSDVDIAWLNNREAVARSENSIRSKEHFLHSKLSLSNQEFSDEDVFTCRVKKNMCPSLTSQKAPEKDKAKRSAPKESLFGPRFQADKLVTISCIVDGFRPPDVSIVWHRNDRLLTEGSQSSEDPSLMNSTLTINRIDWNEEEANYYCVIGRKGLNVEHTQKTSE